MSRGTLATTQQISQIQADCSRIHFADRNMLREMAKANIDLLRELNNLFYLIDHTEARTPVCDPTGPCGTFLNRLIQYKMQIFRSTNSGILPPNVNTTR